MAFVALPQVTVVAVTKEVADSVLQETGVDAAIIPHSVPKCFYDAGRNRSNRNVAPLKLLYVGELSEKKGVRLLVDLMATAMPPGVELTVVGAGPLDYLVAEDKPNVSYLGTVQDRNKLATIMSQHDVLVLLSQRTKSWEELFGIVLIEAIASGCAVIATNHIGPREILSDCAQVGLFDESDINGITSLIKAMHKDRKIVSQLHSLQCVSYKYSIDQVTEKWLEVLTCDE